MWCDVGLVVVFVVCVSVEVSVSDGGDGVSKRGDFVLKRLTLVLEET